MHPLSSSTPPLDFGLGDFGRVGHTRRIASTLHGFASQRQTSFKTYDDPDSPPLHRESSFSFEKVDRVRSVEMSSGFCSARKATVDLTAHSGKVWDTTPAVAARCPKPKKNRSGKGRDHRGHK
jgi:hypothetical protein